MKRVAASPWARMAGLIALFVLVALLLYWRGPEWGAVADAFRLVEIRWVIAAVIFNLLSAVTRAFAWQTVIHEALPEDTPKFSRTSSPRSGSGCSRTRCCPDGSASSRAWAC